jgi:hypothetical protein
MTRLRGPPQPWIPPSAFAVQFPPARCNSSLAPAGAGVVTCSPHPFPIPTAVVRLPAGFGTVNFAYRSNEFAKVAPGVALTFSRVSCSFCTMMGLAISAARSLIRFCKTANRGGSCQSGRSIHHHPNTPLRLQRPDCSRDVTRFGTR